MIDVHAHILPDVDDGPMNLLDSIEMANSAVTAGITHLFASPHHLNEFYENKKINILEKVRELEKHLKQLDIPLTIYPSQEVRIHKDLFKSLDRDEILTLDNKGMYLLIELPSNQVPDYTHDHVYELLLRGITPIIVHPERNKEILMNPSILFHLIQEGALTQVTAGSITGSFGKKIKSFSEKMIEHSWVHLIASDAHNCTSRGFSLQDAYLLIRKKYGNSIAFLLNENSEVLLRGQKIYTEEPRKMKKKKMGIF